MEKDNGGPAFPAGSGDMRDPTGMTLRDWFAGMASADDVMRHRFENPDGTERDPILTVERAKWEYADEMLAERNRKD